MFGRSKSDNLTLLSHEVQEARHERDEIVENATLAIEKADRVVDEMLEQYRQADTRRD